MAGRPRSVTDTKTFDVSRPSKSKPMGTSRPVIVSHGGMVKDQVVTNKTEEKKPLSAPSVTRKIITPISGDDAPKEKAPEKTDGAPEVKSDIVVLDAEPTPVEEAITETEEKPAEPVEETPEEPKSEPEAEEAPVETEEAAPEETVEEEKTEEVSETEDIEAPAGSDSASVDALAESTEKKKRDAKEEEERAKRDAALQGLIDSKEYVVPIAHDSGKGGHTGLWVLIVILLLALGAYLVIDAELIDVGIKLPYEIIK